MLALIGGLLFATLQELRRKHAALRAWGAGQASTEAPRAREETPEPAAPDDVTAGVPPESAVDAGPALEETPEWEPQPAARATEEDDGALTEKVATEAETGLGGDIPETAWAEPTPTAITEASVWDEPDLDESAGNIPEGAFGTSELELSPPGEVMEDPAAEPEPDLRNQRSLREVSAVVAAEENIPEEEPFERAGRWWFKRGSELLVYNEQTGEWMPSPTPLPALASPNGGTPPSSRYGPDTSATQTISDISASGPEPEPEPVLSTARHGFWKCPACGAVNGSTSETCRMCFAARPAD